MSCLSPSHLWASSGSPSLSSQVRFTLQFILECCVMQCNAWHGAVAVFTQQCCPLLSPGAFLPVQQSTQTQRQCTRAEVVANSAGTTVYGIEEQSGLISLHLDAWDSVSNQEYFSVEAFMEVLSQIFNFQRTPDIPSPNYTLLQCAHLPTTFVVAALF